MKITTLIPAYKPQYLTDLLKSLYYQTRRSDRIIVSDDSPHGEFRAELFSPRYERLRTDLNIECIDGPRSGAYANFKHLIRYWDHSSELVHLMLDDDVCYPEFYNRHLMAHSLAPLSCSISSRWVADDTGMPVYIAPIPHAVQANQDRMITLSPKVLFQTSVSLCQNWFGEFSNIVMRDTSCELLLTPEIGGVSYAGLWDLGFVLSAGLRAPVGYIHENLGFFRTGGAGNSSNQSGPFMKGAMLGYAALALGGHRVGQLELKQALDCFNWMGEEALRRWPDQADMQPFHTLLKQVAAQAPGAEAAFLSAWADFRQRNRFD